MRPKFTVGLVSVILSTGLLCLPTLAKTPSASDKTKAKATAKIVQKFDNDVQDGENIAVDNGYDNTAHFADKLDSDLSDLRDILVSIAQGDDYDPSDLQDALLNIHANFVAMRTHAAAIPDPGDRKAVLKGTLADYKSLRTSLQALNAVPVSFPDPLEIPTDPGMDSN